MIVAIVNFKLPEGLDERKATELFRSSAPKYRGMRGLVRKYYVFDKQRRIGGGVYLWKTKADAQAVYTAEWKAYIKERYGEEPTITYFDAPVIVDNISNEIQLAA
jgi:hypothetical protein